MLLFELLDKPLEWQETFNSPEGYVAEFNLPDGRTFGTVFEFVRDEPPIYEISFSDKQASKQEVHDISNKGSELLIFATVMDIIQTFVADNPDSLVYFTAKEPSRQKLYNRMVSRFVKPPLSSATRVTDNGNLEIIIGTTEMLEQYRNTNSKSPYG